MTATVHCHITGYLVGSLYWPVGVEAWKPCHIDLNDAELTLRDHITQYMMREDGDFIGGATIAQGELVCEIVTYRERRGWIKRRTWPLDHFKSISDYLHTDPDWLPCYADDDVEMEGSI